MQSIALRRHLTPPYLGVFAPFLTQQKGPHQALQILIAYCTICVSVLCVFFLAFWSALNHELLHIALSEAEAVEHLLG